MASVENEELQLAFDFVKYTTRNIFLTGKAGTGKTTFLHNLKKSSPKRMIVVAPTGVAAINAGGVTIHSFFQLPLHPFVPTLYLSDNNHGNHGGGLDRNGYKMSRDKINIIRSIDLLVIDEISMVRSDLLDAVDSALRRYRDRNNPFGGIQLLMIGDLQQLAPVVKDEDREIIGKYYDSPYFFGSRALKSTDYITIELKHIYRQNDQVFIDLLNKVRNNHVDSQVIEELNKRYVPDFDPDTNGGYITLTTHNAQAAMLNDSKLEKLPGKAHRFKALIEDDFPEFSYPASDELILKKGARVMFIKNDFSRNKLYFNGKLGVVESFDEDGIMIRCPGDEHPIRVEMAEWQNMKYTLDEETKDIEEKVIGVFRQYPLRLAWAITIHKSQGLTFDRAVIDARAAFAHGQVYVALSRCRTLEGLVLSSRISQRSIVDDQSVSTFINETSNKQPGRKELADSRKDYQRRLLTELFDFKAIPASLRYCIRIIAEHHSSILGDPREKLETAMSQISTDLTEVAEKFQPQWIGLLNKENDAESNIPLQERLKKAAAFFSDKLEAALGEFLEGYSVETDNKTVRKTVSEAFDRLRKEASVKTACLNKVRSGFTVTGFLEARAKAAVEIPVKKPTSKPEDDSYGSIEHPALISRLKAWRNMKAKETDMPHYMILPQGTIINLTRQLPQSVKALKKVKGMGKKKSEKYGEELINIIAAYCEKEKIEVPEEKDVAITKIPKPDTRKISFDLFRTGKTPSQIAAERNLNITTIEAHLAIFVEKGEIPVSEFVSQEIVDLISVQFKDSEDYQLKQVKEKLGDKVTWSDLRFVVNHLKYLKKAGK